METTQAARLEPKNSKPVLFVRTVAEALTRAMDRNAESRLHWAQAAGPEVSWGPPQQVWPQNAWPNFGYFIEQGNNEGYRVKVTSCEDSATLPNVQVLMDIKILCCLRESFNQARLVMEFITTLDVEALLKEQNSR